MDISPCSLSKRNGYPRENRILYYSNTEAVYAYERNFGLWRGCHLKMTLMQLSLMDWFQKKKDQE